MIGNSIKLRSLFSEPEVHLKRVNALINDRKEIDTFKAKKNSGWRAHRQKIKEIMGTVESEE